MINSIEIGPGQYNVNLIDDRAQPLLSGHMNIAYSFSKSERDLDLARRGNPGPGEYEIPSVFKK